MKMSFRYLSLDEIKKFKVAARKEYVPFSDIKGIWHPVYQQECVHINIERSAFTDDIKEE